MQKIYLDNGASTRVADEVIETMLPYFSEHYGNPSNSMHCFGEEAMHEIQNATTTILEHFNSVRHGTLIYTSGASEANNLAIKGILQKAEKPCHIITSPFEHDSVLNAILSCANQNVSYSFVQVDTDGIIDLDDLEKKYSQTHA